MEKMNEPLELTFTSYRDSKKLDGLKISLERQVPRVCWHLTMPYLLMPVARNVSRDGAERICEAVLDNNWDLVQHFFQDAYELGIRKIVLCDWCTKEQIVYGKFCAAGVIGRYIRDKADRDKEFEFPVEITYRDGREVL